MLSTLCTEHVLKMKLRRNWEGSQILEDNFCVANITAETYCKFHHFYLYDTLEKQGKKGFGHKYLKKFGLLPYLYSKFL